MTEKPVESGESSLNLNATRPVHRVRIGLAGTLLGLQALFAASAGANTLAVERADAIREKMARQDPQQSQDQKESPVKQAQYYPWSSWGNWGNWPGWLPKKLQKWRWPRA